MFFSANHLYTIHILFLKYFYHVGGEILLQIDIFIELDKYLYFIYILIDKVGCNRMSLVLIIIIININSTMD